MVEGWYERQHGTQCARRFFFGSDGMDAPYDAFCLPYL